MIDDDDLFVVIVDDDKNDANAEVVHKVETKLKREPRDSYLEYKNDWKLHRKNSMEQKIKVENILYTAQEHGEILHFDEVSEPKRKELKVEIDKEFSDTILVVDDDNDNDDGDEDDDDDDDNYKLQFVCEDDQSSADYSTDGDRDDIKIKGTHWRNTNKVMVSKSYIQKLKENFPHLRDNNEYIIQVLVQNMKNTVPPDPPQNFVTYDGGRYRCTFCNDKSPTESLAERHYQEKHGERYLSCYACGATFRCSTNLYKHEKLNCPSRDILIVLKARALHLGRKGSIPDLRNTPRKRYSCTLCTATFKHKNSLETHLRMHRGERPFVCPHCQRAYTSQFAMTYHMKKHGDIHFICDHCGKVFTEKGKLVIHLESHAPVRKYGCEECPTRYSTKADLTVHVNSDHKNLPLPFDCKICPKRFARMATLKCHMRKNHGMVIITSRMFARLLPEMSEKQLETRLQHAIVVLKNPDSSYSNIEDHRE